MIRNVHIVKTFGGVMPHLPVCYLGNGRFAVAKTVKDDVKVPEPVPAEDRTFGAAEAVTMLIDGWTGKLIEETKPAVYNHNPYPEIPDTWWAAGMKPETPKPEVARKSLFQMHENKREIRFAGDMVVQLDKDDEIRESDDGGYVVIYQKIPRGGKSKTLVKLRILDGKTGQIHTATVESDFYEVLVEASWKMLTAASPDARTLKDFQDGRRGPERFQHH